MRHSFLLLLSFFSFLTASAQISIGSVGQTAPTNTSGSKVKQHATWKVEVVPSHPAVGEEAELVLKADIEEGWYLYSSDFDPNLGPIVTTLTFKTSEGYKVVGKLVAVHPKKKFDDIWGGDITYFIGKAEFRQKIKIVAANPTVKGVIEYQTCTIKDGACVAGEYDVEVAFVTSEKKNDKIVPVAPTATPGDKKGKVDLPKEEAKSIVDSASKAVSVETSKPAEPKTIKATQEAPVKTKDLTLWAFFVQAFLFGLVGLVTPCVFPMVPMTVTFFTKTSKSHSEAIKKGLIYGLSIIFIYTVIGTLVAVFFGADAANFISTHWLPNLFFFAVFIVFAASFLGLFEITLPSWLVNKADEQSDKGGLAGIFFMAATIVLVSFSCTGPIVGTVLIESAGGKFVKPIIGMFGFSLGFSLPFTLFAMFPSWLKAMPKSGGWLNSVKVTLGFLELALALKFFSQADQVYNWRILDREWFIALWIVIFTMAGFYLLRKIKLSHDDVDYREQPVSVPRIFFALTSFAFVVYMLPGMFGAPLKALSGYLPPISTADFVLGQSIHNSQPTTHNSLCEAPKYAELFHLPHGLQGYYDLKQAQACAKQQNKPLFIDFTGRGCANCREMEANVWSDPEVLKRLKEEYVIASLYVDAREELPKAEWYVSSYDGKEKTTIGKQNTDLEIRLFNNNAQPLYVVANAELSDFLEPRAYNRDVSAFVKFLDEGIVKYTKK